MGIEDPGALLQRLNLSREEQLQRLVTMLIVGLYPKGDSRLAPTPSGAQFLQRLDEKSFGAPGDHRDAVFIDEFKLARRAVDTKDGSCDWALLTNERVWMIELKTEHRSHDPAQLPWYLALARHNYPYHLVDLTYLTGPQTYPGPVVPARAR